MFLRISLLVQVHRRSGRAAVVGRGAPLSFYWLEPGVQDPF